MPSKSQVTDLGAMTSVPAIVALASICFGHSYDTQVCSILMTRSPSVCAFWRFAQPFLQHYIFVSQFLME